jgi:hypothetical protein
MRGHGLVNPPVPTMSMHIGFAAYSFESVYGLDKASPTVTGGVTVNASCAVE